MAELLTAAAARQLVTEADQQPPGDLHAWVQGFCAGYDHAAAGALGPVLHALAEDLACLDQASFVGPARLERARCIAAETADNSHQVGVRFDDPTWPPVAVPGAPGLHVGYDYPHQTAGAS
jgi:hypothetical protein